MNFLHARVLGAIGRHGPLNAFHQLIAENDAMIARPSLDNGRRIVEERTAIFTGMVLHWAEEMHNDIDDDKPFAVVATGGTGRGEITPFSDTDFALIFEHKVEGNTLAEKLLYDLVSDPNGGFSARYGFKFHCPTFSFEDVPTLDDKTLNGMLDMRPVYDPGGLAAMFRARIRAHYDSFRQFLHVRSIWKEEWEKGATESERLEGFHIKNDALRAFLAGIWTLAGKEFDSSQEIYGTELDRRDLEAYEFLLRVRTYVHWRRKHGRGFPKGTKLDWDMMSLDDFVSFGELLGPEADESSRLDYAERVRWRLLCARRRVARFAKGVIYRELRAGRKVPKHPDIILGAAGLYHAKAGRDWNARDRSSGALGLLRASQKYGVPIDPAELQATFHNGGDWLMRVPELSALFYEDEGCLANSLEFLSQVEGAEDRLFPGYKHFEVSIDERVTEHKTSLRGVFERQKLQALDDFLRTGRELLKQPTKSAKDSIPLEPDTAAADAALLDQDQLAAVKLALKIKRLPVLPEDVEAAGNGPGDSGRRTGGYSGILLDDYCDRLETECGFTKETIRLTKHLIAHRRLLKNFAEDGPNDDHKVKAVVECCVDARCLRALYVFTCADRAHWQSPKDRADVWELIRELYSKAMLLLHPELELKDSLHMAGFDAQQREILKDFGPALYGGNYQRFTVRFGGHLADLAERPDEAKPKAAILREGDATILAVAAKDYPGLAATITGALKHSDISMLRAHFFSAAKYGLAFDFFHLSPRDPKVTPSLAKTLESAVIARQFISDADEAGLPRISGHATVREWRPGKYCIQFDADEDHAGLVYALTYKVHKYLRGNIFALSAETNPGRQAFIAVYFEAPPEVTFNEIKRIVAEKFAT